MFAFDSYSQSKRSPRPLSRHRPCKTPFPIGNASFNKPWPNYHGSIRFWSNPIGTPVSNGPFFVGTVDAHKQKCEAGPLPTKTTKCRYFHFRHLMKILVVIWTYHRSDFSLFWLIFTYFHLFSLIFLGSDLIIDDVFFFYTFFEISRRFFFLWNKWYVLSFFQERYAVRKGHFL